MSVQWQDYMESIGNDVNRIKKCKTLKNLIKTKGIPTNLRCDVWPRICNSYLTFTRNQDSFNNVLKANEESVSPWTEQIEKDLPRTFPNNVWFHRDEVQNSLKRVLYAFSWLKPEIGYTQAMNYMAAMLLFLINEENKTWMVYTVVEELLPPNYYCNGLIGVQIDVDVFKLILMERLPKVAKHFIKYDVDIALFVTQWFLCLFISLLPMESATRFIDSFLYEGSKMLFRVAFALFNMNKERILSSTDTSELLDICQNLPSQANDPDVLMEYSYDERYLLRFSFTQLENYRKQSFEARLQLSVNRDM